MVKEPSPNMAWKSSQWARRWRQVRRRPAGFAATTARTVLTSWDLTLSRSKHTSKYLEGEGEVRRLEAELDPSSALGLEAEELRKGTKVEPYCWRSQGSEAVPSAFSRSFFSLGT
jgi:hypothetical protein